MSEPTAISSTGPGVPGDRVGPYRLVRLVGQGGMGVVYEAWDDALKRRVALKLLSGAARSPQALERFRQEATLAGRLRHPSIVVVHEAGEAADGRAFIAMEFVEGRTLEQEIDARLGDGAHLEGADREAARREAARGLDAAAVRRVVAACRDVARALHCGHTHVPPGADAPAPIVHRDVKPGNIIIDSHGTARLLDYGLAKETGVAMTVTREALGTPLYMSPEQLFSARRVGPKSDVYSLGMTLYACLTLARPFELSAPGKLFEHLLRDEPIDPRRLNPTLPEDLRTVILAATAKDEGRRYASAADLADDLEAWLEGRPIRAKPAGALRRAQAWLRRRPAAVVALMAPLAVGLGGTVWWYLEQEAARHSAQVAAANQAHEQQSLLDANRMAAEELDDARFLFELAAIARLEDPDGERWLQLLNEGSRRERQASERLSGRSTSPDVLRRAALARAARRDRTAEPELRRLTEKSRVAEREANELRSILARLQGHPARALGPALLRVTGLERERSLADRALVDPAIEADLLAARAICGPELVSDLQAAAQEDDFNARELLLRAVSARIQARDPLARARTGIEATLAQLDVRPTLVAAGPEGLAVEVVACGPDGLPTAAAPARGATGQILASPAAGDVLVRISDPARPERAAVTLAARTPRPAWGGTGAPVRVPVRIQPADVPAGMVAVVVEGAAPFAVDAREVPVRDYERFLADIAASGHATCPPAEQARFPGGKDHRQDAPVGPVEPEAPVTGVDWWDAAAFAAWAGKRLPTAAEWARAATGDQPWRATLAAANLRGLDDGALWVDPVGGGHLAPCGARHLVGNVAEWLGGGDDGVLYREAAGGGWATERPEAADPARLVERFDPLARGADLGLRCVVDLAHTRETAPAPPAERRVRERDGAAMRLVPGGPRLMGGTIVKRAGWQNPQLHAPRVEVELSPFHADERPITRRQLRAWLDATDPRVQPPLTGPPDAPAVVSWEDAAAYAAWVGGRLPTEAEWEALRDAGHVSDDGWEWCADAWHPEFVKFAPRRDPVNRWTADRGHVVRQPEARSVGGGRGRFRVVTDVTGGGR